MNEEINLEFNKFKQVIIWGFPLHTHTHSYIHGAWFKTFKYLGINVYWFHDKEFPSDFDYSNSCFITEGYADENIPINETSTYFVHIARNPDKYLSKGCRLIEIRYNVLEIHDCNYDYKLPEDGINLSHNTIYEIVKDDRAVAFKNNRNITQNPYEVIYMYWATDLLPHEFNYDDAKKIHDNKIIYYVGSGNENIIKFKNSCENSGINFIQINPWHTPVSYEENIKLMKNSYCCPDFRSNGEYDKHLRYGKMNGTNHIDIGYIPCRVFKAISYGHTGITNSKRVKKILGDFVEYVEFPEMVLDIVDKRKNDIEWRKECMKYVADNHTYIQRVYDLNKALKMKKEYVTHVTALFDIGRDKVDGRSISEYKNMLIKTLTTIKDPFVVYLDKSLDFKNEIIQVRKNIGPIKIIETRLEEIPMWLYYEKVKSIINNEDFLKSLIHPNDITNKIPEYTLIQYSKFGWLENTINKNPFNSKKFVWIDAGFSRFYDTNNIYEINKDKIQDQLFYICANDNAISKLNYITYDNYICTNECILMGSLWIMDINSFNIVIKDIMKIWNNEMLNKNRLDNEQIALALIAKYNTNIFNFIYNRGRNNGSIFDNFYLKNDNSKKFEKYKFLLENALTYFCKDEDYIKYFGKIPKTRRDTFQYCLDFVNKNKNEKIKIVELGTSRSFVDGRFPGCNSDNINYWQPNNPLVWDWSAGSFTRIFSECTNDNVILETVDLEYLHIQRCKIMTKDFSNKINYFIMPSEEYLTNCNSKSIDLLYLDTGDVNPVEPTALLHLREAKIIVEKDLIKDDGIILIDDVKNLASKTDAKEESNFGKAKYSIPYFLNNGYELIMDEYQVIIKKSR
jgi:hypothetical protein